MDLRKYFNGLLSVIKPKEKKPSVGVAVKPAPPMVTSVEVLKPAVPTGQHYGRRIAGAPKELPRYYLADLGKEVSNGRHINRVVIITHPTTSLELPRQTVLSARDYAIIVDLDTPLSPEDSAAWRSAAGTHADSLDGRVIKYYPSNLSLLDAKWYESGTPFNGVDKK